MNFPVDNITHTIVGVAMGQAGLKRWSPYATALLILGANGPDIDVFAGWGADGARYLEVHRGISHSFVGAPVLALTAAWVLWLWHRRHHKDVPYRWLPATGLALIGVLSHLLLDFITPYGTRLLLPFSNARLGWDIFPVLDLWLLPVILFAMVLPFFFRLISSEIGAKKTSFRPAAIFVLVFLVLLGGVRATAHRRVMALVDSFLYKGREPVRASAFPESASPFRWHVVIDTEASLEEADVNVFEDFDPTATRSFYPPEPNRALDVARQTRTAQAFFDFAQYPYIYIDQREEGYEVVFRDLRYEYGTMMLRKGAVVRVRLDGNLRVTSQHFSFRDSGDVR